MTTAKAPLVVTTPTERCFPLYADANGSANSRNSLKNVLHVINGEHFSGAERVQQLLGQGLSKEGYQAHFACLKPGKFASHANLPSELIHTTEMRSRFDRSVIQKISDLAVSIEANMLHAHTPRSAMVTARVAKRIGLPMVYHVHSPTVRDSTRKVLNWMNAIVERRALKHCDAIVTVSESLRNEMFRQGIPASKVYVAPNGVPVCTPVAANQRLMQTHWRFGVVALFRPRKGLELLLDAFDRLCSDNQTNNTYSLDIIGGFETPAYEESIRNQLARLQSRDAVRLHGFVTDAPNRMRELDILVLPSIFGEGMPMVVLEAMANGIPVVATRVEGTPEVVRDQVEGWLAEPGDVSGLTNCMESAASSRPIWSQYAANAFKRQRERFSDQTMCETIAEVYRAIES